MLTLQNVTNLKSSYRRLASGCGRAVVAALMTCAAGSLGACGNENDRPYNDGSFVSAVCGVNDGQVDGTLNGFSFDSVNMVHHGWLNDKHVVVINETSRECSVRTLGLRLLLTLCDRQAGSYAINTEGEAIDCEANPAAASAVMVTGSGSVLGMASRGVIQLVSVESSCEEGNFDLSFTTTSEDGTVATEGLQGTFASQALCGNEFWGHSN